MELTRLTAGHAALAAGVMMIVGTQGEWVLDAQRNDGTVSNLPVFALLLLVATAGFALLLAATLGLRRTTQERGKPARIGSTLTVAGAGLLSLFGVTHLLSTLTTGAPWEPVFITFLLGMLLLAIGPVTLGLSLRDKPRTAGLWQMLLATGVLALAALMIEPDPWHDLSLVGTFAGWSVIGLILTRAPGSSGKTRPPGTRRRRDSTVNHPRPSMVSRFSKSAGNHPVLGGATEAGQGTPAEVHFPGGMRSRNALSSRTRESH